MSVAIAADGGLPLADGRVAEERLLGSADEDAQYLACQPFTREIAADGVVAQSLDASLAKAGVPAAAMLEARQALATSLDLGRDIGAGDRFYVRYQQTFTAEGTPIGVGRVMWAELRTKAKGTIALHRFRPARRGRAALAGERGGGDAAFDAPAARHDDRLVGLRPARRPARQARGHGAGDGAAARSGKVGPGSVRRGPRRPRPNSRWWRRRNR